jgi:hypothetical protein
VEIRIIAGHNSARSVLAHVVILRFDCSRSMPE